MATREQLGVVVERLIDMVKDDTHSYQFDGQRLSLLNYNLQACNFIGIIEKLAEKVEVTK